MRYFGGYGTLALAGAILVAVAPASAQNAMAPARPPVQATLPTEASTPAGFAVLAALGDRFEVESSNIAFGKTESDEIMKFAHDMVMDHTRSTGALLDAVRLDKLTVDFADKLDSAQEATLQKLREATTSAQADRLYLDAQLEGHHHAVDMFRNYAQSGPAGALKQFAAETLPVIEGHLQRLQQLQPSKAVNAR